MKILILYNIAQDLKKGTATDLLCEQEITIIIPLVEALLRQCGYQVETLETTPNLWNDLLSRKGSFDLVLNMAEAFGGGNTDEPLIPAMLEALGIPFTGASAHNMHLTLDKEKTKLVAQGYDVPVPAYQLFQSASEPLKADLAFPLIVKPIREEASIGIHADNVVTNETDLRRKAAELVGLYRQPAIVEQFIAGREISVGVIGNGDTLHVFPPLEFLFAEGSSPLTSIRSYEYKWGGKKEHMVRATLPEEIAQQLLDYTTRVFVATECRDYARMDYRITDQGDIYLLEVNYNPGIGPNTHGLNNTLTMMASFEGHGFEDLVKWIVRTAANRENLLEAGQRGSA